MVNAGQEKDRRRVFVVDGSRTPFLKAQKGLGPFTGSDLAVNAGRPLLLRQPFGPEAFDEVIIERTPAASRDFTPADPRWIEV